MFGKTYYHESLRRYVILFGTLFNDIWINRKDNTGKVKQSLQVPLAYGPREKFLARVEADPNLDQAFAIVLPAMSFEITGYNYAGERKLQTIDRFVKKTSDSNSERTSMYNPVPWDVNFQLNAFVKNIEDGLMIVEQILPYFTPEWTTTIRLVDDPEITLDIPLILNGISSDDIYEGSFEERRALTWTFDFTMKCQFFGPSKDTGIIRMADVNFFDDIPETL